MGFITGFMWALFIIVILVLLATIFCLMTGLVALYDYANDMLRDSPSIDKVLPEFMEFVSDMTIIGHNVHFDINFIYAF